MKEIQINGIVNDGPFRPSDWRDRLASVISAPSKVARYDNRIEFSYGKNGVLVFILHNPTDMEEQFLIEFGYINKLPISTKD